MTSAVSLAAVQVKIIAAMTALTMVGGGGAWAAAGFPGTSLASTCTATSPSDVADQTAGAGGTRAVDVTWTAPQPVACGALGYYNIVVINGKGQPGQVVATAPADSTSATVSGTSLNLCTWYRLGVQSVLASGQESRVTFAARPAFVSGPPDKVPPAIFLIVTGTRSKGPADQFDPASADFCTSPKGVLPSTNGHKSLQHLADSWLNAGDPHPDAKTSGVGNNLIDSLAATGGYVLPYSYTGIDMTGTAANPSLTVGAFTTTDVSVANPMGPCTDFTCRGLGEPPLLQASLASIHSVFPDTPIIVIAHSLGGLIAEQWWLQYSQKNTEGVVQVISLDSPLNGVAAGGVSCVLDLDWFCGPDSAIAYQQLWQHQQDPAGSGPYANNQTALRLDAENHLFTAIGDIGDPVYDDGDYFSSSYPGVKNIGLMSQVFWTEPSCVQSSFNLTSQACTATGQAIIDPCGQAMNDGMLPASLPELPLYLWVHSVVKNCPQVISDALAWYHHALAHPVRPSPSPSAAPSPTAGLPSLKADSGGPVIRPQEISFSGDSTNVVASIKWSSWTAVSAQGTGTSPILSCVPNCAQGSATPAVTTLTLSDPVNGDFTNIQETRDGNTSNYSFTDPQPGFEWPLWAGAVNNSP